MQLIVLGMHRSGTSVLARLLNLMGAYFGPEGVSTGASSENPKGFWERRDVRMLNDHVLHSVGCDWNKVRGFDPANLPDAVIAEFTKRAFRLVLEMDAHRPWLLKEPRLCLLFPLWRQVLDVPACIHIYRHPVEVAASLNSRNGIPIPAGLALWERYVRSALAASEGLPSIAVSHRRLMQQPCEAIRQLSQDLEAIGETGLRTPPEAEVAAFVRDDLYRQKERRDDLLSYRNAIQVQLFEELTTGNGKPFTNTPMDAASEHALAEYEASLPPLKPSSIVITSSAAKAGKAIAPTTVAATPSELGAIDGASHEPGGLGKRRAAVGAELCLAAAERTRLRDALNRAENAKVEAEQALSERFSEIAELTRILLDKDASIALHENQRRAFAKAVDAARKAETAARMELQRARDDARTLLNGANARLAAVERELDRSRADAGRQKEQLRTLEALLRSTGARAARSERHSEQLTSDFSWRLSLPLRVIARWIGQRTSGDVKWIDEAEELQDSGLFDTAWYLEQNSDVAGQKIDPVHHYLEHGALEQRNPGPGFDTAFYLASNPDVAASGINPLVHFIRHGQHEGRLPYAKARIAAGNGHGRH